MKYSHLNNVAKDISRVAMGTMAFKDAASAVPVYENFISLGGNCFETARHYGAAEEILGHWVRRRDIREEVVLITKGAHTPNCYPEAVTEELFQSLDRLQTDYVDVYFLHRDNPDVPVGEFVDVLNEHKDEGRIKVFGGSNWTVERVQEANAYAARKGLTGFSALSNNFSLAKWVAPPWPGCETASDPDSRRWLDEQQMPLFPWSSQARGFFVEGRAAPDDLSDAELARCWYSDDNFRRLERARSLAAQKDTIATAIALAYVLHQPFGTFPIIGPLSPQEASASLEALDIDLTPTEVRWLDQGDLG
jgi:aryl-alcohol dehydrogenase-like predicted oxidoreductase